MIKPIATTCMAMSFGILNKLAANGINSKEPPATPEAPQALMVATKLNSNAEAKVVADGFEKPEPRSSVTLIDKDNVDELVRLLHEEAKVI